jgi:putative transcriptional regulator
MKCLSCGGEMMETRLDSYHFAECGLENVTLVGVRHRKCGTCGKQEVVIRKMKELHRLLAMRLAAKNSLLTPNEVRFLRKHLGYSGTDFAAHIGVRPETVSRWETGKEELSWHFELLLRSFVLLQLHDRNYTSKAFDQIEKTRSPARMRIFAEESQEAWRPEAGGMLAAAS